MRASISASLAGLLCCCGIAAGQVRFSEVFINPPGSDSGLESIELRSDTPGYSLANLTVLVIEGDCGTGCVAGVVDQALSLSVFSTGSNNLFLWRDSVLVLDPAPESATTTHVADFSPDLENGSNTWLIVEGFTGTVGLDLDTNNDGVLDSQPWTRVLDAVGYLSDGEILSGKEYATQLGGLDITDRTVPPPPDGNPFTCDVFTRICDQVFALDVLGTNPGPYPNDVLETLSFPTPNTPLPLAWVLTIGSPNIDDGCAPTGCIVTCDFNQDGGGDTSDVIDLADAIASGSDPFPASCIDFNQDGGGDTSDVIDMADAIASGTCP